jgi:hypothetical protein
MSKPVLLACLLAVLGACADSKLIGTASVDAGDISWGDAQPDLLIAASEALRGDWKSAPVLAFPGAFAKAHFEPEFGRARGTFTLSCLESCAGLVDAVFNQAPQSSARAFDFSDGQYMIVGRNSKGLIRALMFNDTFASGFTFEFADADSEPPAAIALDFFFPVLFEPDPPRR